MDNYYLEFFVRKLQVDLMYQIRCNVISIFSYVMAFIDFLKYNGKGKHFDGASQTDKR